MHNNQTQASLDAGGDTDPATDIEETVVGMKRKIGQLARKVSTYVF